MKIGIIGSMQFTQQMLEVRNELTTLGHDAFVTELHKAMVGKNAEEIESIKLHQKNNCDAIREFWRMMQGADAVLVLNLDKNGVARYIGANTFLEIGFAHVLGQKIYLWQAPPDDRYIITELNAMCPITVERDLSRIN